jgi:hypothetical protein
MTEYKSAYETMDAEAVGRLLSLPVERLKQVFGQARSYSVDFQCGPPTFRSDINATTTCQTAITAVMKVGDGRKTRQTSNRTLQLTKNGSSWSVASVQ